MRPPSAAQSRAVAVAPAPRGFPVVACLESIARGTRCLLLTHTSISICRSSNRLWKPDFEGEAIPEQRDYDWLVIDDEDPLRHVRFTAMHSCAPHVRISV